MEIRKSELFEKWFNRESIKSQYQIASRLARIVQYDHFGDHKLLGENLAELRWKCGRRIYYTIFKNKGTIVLLLIGGYKNGQNKDIKKAKNLIKKHQN